MTISSRMLAASLSIAYPCCDIFSFAANAQEMVIAPQYEAVRNFHEGLAPVRIDELWGLIDRKGNIVVSPQFSDVSTGSDGFFAFEGETAGFIRAADGKKFFDRFTKTRSFNNGVAAVQMANGLWGYINRDGTWFFPAVFQEIGDWQNDCGAVKVNDAWGLACDDGKFWSYSEYSDEQPLPVEFPHGAASNNGTYVMEVGGKQRFVRRVASIGYSDVSEDEEIGAEEQAASEEIASQHGAIGTGLFIEERFNKYTRLRPFHDGWAAASSDGKLWTFINENGDGIGEVFENVRDFSEGVAGVKKRGKWGFINSRGEILVEPTYDAVYSFNEKVAVVRAGTRRGFLRLSENGKISVFAEPRFDDVLRFKEGVAPVMIDGKWGFFGFDSWSSVRTIQNVSAN